ncbi:MAG: sugar kinase [Polaromonas sp.]|nr:sugar kinase [Polaromonas sp.]
MTTTLDLVTFGEAVALFAAVETGELGQARTFRKSAAGAEINVAIGLARLGLSVAWCSRLGRDAWGSTLVELLAGEGIDCSHVTLDASHPTGIMFKSRSDDGSDPQIAYHRSGSAASGFGPDDVDAQWLCSARHLHTSGVFAGVSASTLAAQQHAMTLMRAAGRSISFDPNLRPTLWASQNAMRSAINALASLADWILPGIDEGRLLTGESTPEGIARFYRQRGAALVVVKLGADGAYFDGAAGTGRVAGFPVASVVDTVGAGDGFAVGVISALLAGLPVAQAVRRGAWIGARAVQVAGDSEGLPTRAELRAAGF